ncbi:hypothetical protein Taro_056833 [Colocasia esculenta]|uniref:Alkaline/neutral invertase n=1 Tax=Colocasia esculenta TaxID=4460 RepID=A0A843XUX9_COLES|nr:hypothetical protein [Colocasia esculenta]
MTRLNRTGPARADPTRIRPGSASRPSPAEPVRSAWKDRLGYPSSDREAQNRADSADPIPIRPILFSNLSWKTFFPFLLMPHLSLQGIYGYPIEIQALFYMALRCAHQLLRGDGDGKEFLKLIEKRLNALTYHMRSYFWLDFKQLNDIYRFKTEEYSHTAVNKFNVIPGSIPDWVFDFMPEKGGYFIGNVSPARMDFRWFAVGNCVAILSSLATHEQSSAIMDLIEERWHDIVGEMPLKVVFPAFDSHEWRIVTGCDPKNTRWSYHNGGSWPVLLWLLTAACVKTCRPQIARKALELAELHIGKDCWPEYYDGKDGCYVGKQSRLLQTWTMSGYLVAKMLIEDTSRLGILALEDDNMKPTTLARAMTLPTRLRSYGI